MAPRVRVAVVAPLLLPPVPPLLAVQVGPASMAALQFLVGAKAVLPPVGAFPARFFVFARLTLAVLLFLLLL